MTKSVRNRNKHKSSQSSSHRASQGLFAKYRAMLKNRMEGGAFSVDVGQQIAGMPAYQSYSDCCAPAIIDHKLVIPSQASSCGASVGGGTRRRSSRHHKGNQKRKHTKATTGGRRSARRSRASLKQRQNAAKRGGSMLPNLHQSRSIQTPLKRGGGMPAPYDIAFKGETSNFSDNMMNREFACSQPSWSPACA
jgi:hypothetical protein